MTVSSAYVAESTAGSAPHAAPISPPPSLPSATSTPAPPPEAAPPPEITAHLTSIAHALARLRDIEWWRLADDALLASATELETVLRSGHGAQIRLAAEIADRPIAEAAGERSPAHLLATALRIPPGQARSRIATARLALGSDTLTGDHLEPAMPQLLDALDTGAISDDHAAVITRSAATIPESVDDDTRTLCHQLLLDEAGTRDPVSLKRVGEQIRLICNPDGSGPCPDPVDRAELHIGALRPDGLTAIHGLLDPLTVEQLRVAVEALAAPRPIDEKTPDPRPAPLRRVHALTEILTRYFAAGCHSRDPGAGLGTTSNLPAVALTIPVASLIPAPRCRSFVDDGSATDDGSASGLGSQRSRRRYDGPAVPGQFDYGNPAAPETARQLACHGILIRQIIDDDGAVLDQGRGRRLFTRAQRRALTTRDRGCAFPGCDIPPGWCQAHHIAPWTSAAAPAAIATSTYRPSPPP